MADSFEAILAKVQKKHDLAVGALSDIAQDAAFITTGNIAIDHIIGGGLPLGRSVELAGPPSSGKTTTALQTAAELQKIIIAGGGTVYSPEGTPFEIKADDKILYMDYEQTIDQKYAKSLGLDIDHPSFLLSQPETLEQGANVAIELIETGYVRMVIWDSVASMMPSVKAQNEIGKSLPAVQAKLMADLGQRLNPLLYRHQTLNIFVNHLREVMDMSGRRPGHLPPRKDTPGGSALKFYASVRVEYKQVGNVKETITDDLTGEDRDIPGATNVEVKVTKNKVAPPFRVATVRVRFGRGFDNFWTAIQILVSAKEVMYSQGYYYFHKVEDEGLAPDWMERTKTGTQRPNIRTDAKLFDAADKNPEWRAAVIAHARKVVTDNALINDGRTPEEAENEQALQDEIDALLPQQSKEGRMSLGG